jgi:fibronectin-binding autotransporter adhesin
MQNDLPDLRVTGISAEYGLVLNGYLLTVTNGISTDEPGSGTITFNCPLFFPQYATVHALAQNGAVTENTIYMHFNGAITVGYWLRLQASGTSDDGGANARIYISGPVFGNGTIEATIVTPLNSSVTSDCSIEFNSSDTNIFAGNFVLHTLANSQIIFNKPSATPVTSGLIQVQGGEANLQLSQPNQIGAGAGINLSSAAKLHLSGNNVNVDSISMQSYPENTNSCTVDTGSVLLGVSNLIDCGTSGNYAGIIKGKLSLNGYLTMYVHGGSALDIQAAIQGQGFQKINDGTLILSSSNSFTGPVDVVGGTLDVRNSGALGNGSVASLSGDGTMILRNVSINGRSLTVQDDSALTTFGTCAWNGPIVLNSDLVVLADDLSLNGAISGSGNLTLLNGTATFGGTVANSFTGTLNVLCSLLQLNKPSSTKAYSGPLVVGDGGSGTREVRWLQSYQNTGATLTLYANGIVNLNNHNDNFGAVIFNGGEVDTGTGQFAIYQPLTVNASSSTATINGYLGLPSGGARSFVVNDGAADPDLLVNAVMIGSPTYFVKQGMGTMRLANANTFVGTTLHESGILDIANPSALGTAGCVIFDGATLRLSTAGSMPNNFEAVGAGVGGTSGAFQVASNSSVTLNGSIQLDTNTVFNVATTAGLGLGGAIGGIGPFTKTGGGVLTFSGGSANTFSGITTIKAGIVNFSKSGGAVSIPGNLVLGPAPAASPAVAIFLSANSIGGNTVTVNANSTMNINGSAQTLSQLNLNDGGSVATGGGTLYLNGGATVAVGSLSLLGTSTGSTITGNIGLPPNDFAINFNVGSYGPVGFSTGPELDVPANISIQSFEDPNLVPTRVNKTGSGRMRLGGANTFKGGVTVSVGTLQVDGTMTGGVTVSGGTLNGTGTVGPIAMGSSSPVVSPGHSPGILTSSNFTGNANGIFRVALNGTNAGTGYSQLVVNGTVNLNNVTLNASLGFASSTNDTFTILSNDGLDAITGTFKGLAQGAQFYIGGELFQISYGGIGKFGNDVILSRLITPPKISLTIERQPTNSVRLLWPTNDPAFHLQYITNLTASNWTTVVETPVVVGTNNVVTNTASGTEKYYRLMR